MLSTCALNLSECIKGEDRQTILRMEEAAVPLGMGVPEVKEDHGDAVDVPPR